MKASRESWTLAANTFWSDRTTLVGGDPFRSTRLTDRGAHFVRAVLEARRDADSALEHALLQRLRRVNLLTAPIRPAASTGDVTVIIPARAAARDVQRVLSSVPGFPAIVVDDGSPVPLTGRLTHDSDLQVVRHSSSLGPSAARNAGAAHATSEWVAFVDSDVIAEAHWIERLIANAQGCCAVAPRILTAPGHGLADRFESAVCALDMGPRPGYVSPTGVLAYVPSAALLVQRAAFHEVGGFTCELQVGEDVDLVWRLADRGVYYEPSVVLQHQARADLCRALRRRALYGSSAGPLAVRHPRLMHHGSYSALAALPFFLAIAGKPRSAIASSIMHVAIAPRTMRRLPPLAAARAAAAGQRRTALALARSLTRPLLPFTIACAAVNRGFGRRALIAAVVGAAAARRSPENALWQLADDAAYSAGVWRGAWRARRPSVLLPRLRLRRHRA